MLRKSKVFTMILAATIFLAGAEGIAPTSTAAEQNGFTAVAEDNQQFEWLPETEAEYYDFVNEYGHLSIHENFIVYCDEVNYSTGDDVIINQSGDAEIKKIKEYNIASEDMAAGNPSKVVIVYEAVSSGDIQLTVSQGRSWDPNAEMTEMESGTYVVNDDLTIEEVEDVKPVTKGDVNDDGDFNVSDAVLLQKWLLAVPDTHLANWKAADFCEDERLDVFDLCLMKRELINRNTTTTYPVENPEVIDEFTPCSATLDDDFMDWKIQVVIKCQYSDPERVWTADDFNGVENIKKVKQYNQVNPYRQVLEISLKKYSKEAVIQMIHDIEALGIEEIKEVATVAMNSGDGM
jgi:hypothetical protein